MTETRATRPPDDPTMRSLWRLGFLESESRSIIETASKLWNCDPVDLGRFIANWRAREISVEQLAAASKKIAATLDTAAEKAYNENVAEATQGVV